ncbi:MAG: hypothetical protein IJF71_03565, partial [Clostridia bacterium]|nr:hypothetical protein [Clostridia bacterium]
ALISSGLEELSVGIYVNGMLKETVMGSQEFSLTLTEGDTVTVKARGFDGKALVFSAPKDDPNGEETVLLSSIEATAKTPINLRITLLDKHGMPFVAEENDLPVTVYLGNKTNVYPFVSYDTGVITVNGLYETDVIYLRTQNYTFFAGGEIILRELDGRDEITWTIYSVYTVECLLTDSEGNAVEDEVVVYLDGIEVARTKNGAFTVTVPHEGELSFFSRRYKFERFIVTESVRGMEIHGERKSGATKLPVFVLIPILTIFAVVCIVILKKDGK